MRAAEKLFMTGLRHYMASRYIGDLSQIVEKKVLNSFHRGHISVRCLHYSESWLEANIALLVVHYAFIRFPYSFHLHIQLLHLEQSHHFCHSFLFSNYQIAQINKLQEEMGACQ